MVSIKSSLIATLFLSSFISGCASTNPPKPPKLDDSIRVPLNQNLGANPTTSRRYTNMRLTISQVIEHYVPADVNVFTDEGVSLATAIQYDNSRPWTESLGASLAAAGIGMVVDLGKRTVILNALPTTLQQVLDAHVPPEFKVYLDQGVNKDTPVKFGTSRPWVEELGASLAAVNYDVIANLDKRIILVRPMAPKPQAKETASSHTPAAPSDAQEDPKTSQELK